MTRSTSRNGLPPVALIGLAVLLLVLVGLSWWMGQLSYSWLPVQASTAAPLVDGLFSFETAIGTFVFGGVVAAMALTLLFHRAEKYDMNDAEPIEGNTRLEITWTVIPLVLVMGIAIYSVQVNTRLDELGPMEHIHLGNRAEELSGRSRTTPLEPGTLEVVARQWSWEFRYPNPKGGGTPVSSSELHLPLGERTTLRLASEDVLHGFYVPAFRLKQDIIPGRVIPLAVTPTREGRYSLRDSQFSGTWFAANQSVVVVESPDSYAAWLKQAASQPLVAAPNRATDEFSQRSRQRNPGWATVPPAPPPMVHDPGTDALPNDARP